MEMELLRKLTKPHMLLHVGLVILGVALLISGSAIGLFLIACALMMGVMMAFMGGGGGADRPADRGHH
jgi:hypothetical protein